MELSAYDKKCVRITEKDGMIFEGIADVCPAEYGLHEFGREEESVSLGRYQIFAGDVRAIELLDGACFCPFYGSEYVPAHAGELDDGQSHAGPVLDHLVSGAGPVRRDRVRRAAEGRRLPLLEQGGGL